MKEFPHQRPELLLAYRTIPVSVYSGEARFQERVPEAVIDTAVDLRLHAIHETRKPVTGVYRHCGFHALEKFSRSLAAQISEIPLHVALLVEDSMAVEAQARERRAFPGRRLVVIRQVRVEDILHELVQRNPSRAVIIVFNASVL